MTNAWRCGLAVVIALVALHLAAAAQAQQAADEVAADQPPSADSAPAVEHALPSFVRQFQRRFIYGATFLEGYDSTRENSTATLPGSTLYTSSWFSDTFTAFRPYVALDLHHGATRLTLQSAPIVIFTPSRVESFGINGFLDPRVGLSFELSHRLWLNLLATATYGDQFSQVLALVSRPCEPPCGQPAADGGITPPQPGASSHLFTSALFSTSGQVALEWHRSEHQEFSVAVGESYSTQPGESDNSRDTSSNVGVARVQMGEHLTPLVNVVGYAQVHQVSSTQFTCTVEGGGLGFQQQIGRFTAWAVEAGPEYSDRGCNRRLGASFSGTFQRAVGERTAVTIAGTRGVDTYYVPGSIWVTSVGAGIHRQTSASTSIEVNGGYLNGSNEINQQAGYSGYFATPRFLWSFTDNLTLAASYGHLTSNRTGSSLDRDWVTLGITWHPNPKSF